jgi:hypothetical protein
VQILRFFAIFREIMGTIAFYEPLAQGLLALLRDTDNGSNAPQFKNSLKIKGVRQ